MPKDSSCLEDAPQMLSPIGGLSDALYTQLVAICDQEVWTKSPVGGLSLPEFLRLLDVAFSPA